MTQHFRRRSICRLLTLITCALASAIALDKPLRAQAGGASEDAPSTADIVRFLEQATWGPTPELLEHVRKSVSRRSWKSSSRLRCRAIRHCRSYPTTRDTAACPNGSACQRDNYTMYPLQNRFFVNALYGEDQLRQRVAFALHQIIVVSGVEVTQPSWMAPYLQTLDRHAFGNYRQLLYDITMNPAMGNYLDINSNTRTRPNENYAREILQLFSIGTARLNDDGTTQLDERGSPFRPTHRRRSTTSPASSRAGGSRQPRRRACRTTSTRWCRTSRSTTSAAKTLLNGVTLPARQNTTKDLNDAIDNIFNHPNVGPFISKQLIQHLVTSNPSPAYVARVAAVFNGGGGTHAAISRPSCARSCSIPRRAAASRPTPITAGCVTPRNSSPTFCGRSTRVRPTAAPASDGYLNPQSVPMGMDVFRPPSVFSYFSPFDGRARHGRRARSRVRHSSRHPRRFAASTSSTRSCSRESRRAPTRRLGRRSI